MNCRGDEVVTGTNLRRGDDETTAGDAVVENVGVESRAVRRGRRVSRQESQM